MDVDLKGRIMNYYRHNIFCIPWLKHFDPGQKRKTVIVFSHHYKIVLLCLMPPDPVSTISDLCLPGKLLNESISEVGTPLSWIQLSPNGRMIMRMMASRGDLQLDMGSETW